MFYGSEIFIGMPLAFVACVECQISVFLAFCSPHEEQKAAGHLHLCQPFVVSHFAALFLMASEKESHFLTVAPPRSLSTVFP